MPALVDRTVVDTLERLRHPPRGSAPIDRSHAVALAEALRRHAALFQSTFLAALRDSATHEMEDTSRGGAAFRPTGGLELMDESRIEADIEISRATQLIDSTAEWELRELQTFTSALAGQEYVTPESNPLRPLAFASALWRAAGAVAPQPGQQSLLTRVAAEALAGQLKLAWAAASSRLEAQGIQPSIYRTVLLPPGSVPGGQETTGPLGDLLQSLPVGSTAPPLAGRVAAAHGARTDPRAVELLTRIFAIVQADTEVAAACRGVIARLQVAALGVAAQDRTLLEGPEHPVWQLMDRIAHASAGHPAQDDPRQASLLAFCHATAEEISRTPDADASSFRRACERVDAFLAEQCRGQLRDADAAVQALQRAERRELLQPLLAQRLVQQAAHVRTTPELRRFVTDTWSKVLAEAMLRFGDDAEPTTAYLKTVDDLLWSLQPPDHPQSRQRLVSMLPGLLQRLRDGMALIELPPAEQQPVFDRLMAVHADALRPGSRAPDETATAQEIVQRMRDEVLPAAPTGDSVIDLASMQTVPADLMHTRPAELDDAPPRVDTFLPGVRQRLFLQGRWRRVQLLWRSEHGSYFLYAGERAGQTHSITRRALERLDDAGLVQPLEARTLVQRTIETLRRQIARGR